MNLVGKVKMFLVLSGEGPSDIGNKADKCGPLTLLIDKWIEPRIDYSLIQYGQFHIFPETEITTRSKAIKAISKRGKKAQPETRFFFKNARALIQLGNELGNENTISILFHDSDDKVSTSSSEWGVKFKSMLDGFVAEGSEHGVPMIPRPKSEVWALCALKHKYQNSDFLEDRSGNDKSQNSLKAELEEYLGATGSRELLNEKVENGDFDITNISMPSMIRFKERLDEVLDRFAGVGPRP